MRQQKLLERLQLRQKIAEERAVEKAKRLEELAKLREEQRVQREQERVARKEQIKKDVEESKERRRKVRKGEEQYTTNELDPMKWSFLSHRGNRFTISYDPIRYLIYITHRQCGKKNIENLHTNLGLSLCFKVYWAVVAYYASFDTQLHVCAQPRAVCVDKDNGRRLSSQDYASIAHTQW